MRHDNSITTQTDLVAHNTPAQFDHITSTAAERQNIYEIIHTKKSRAITERGKIGSSDVSPSRYKFTR